MFLVGGSEGNQHVRPMDANDLAEFLLEVLQGFRAALALAVVEDGLRGVKRDAISESETARGEVRLIREIREEDHREGRDGRGGHWGQPFGGGFVTNAVARGGDLTLDRGGSQGESCESYCASTATRAARMSASVTR